jgi:cysteine desulfurase/selenocysteine lyase
MAVTPGQETPRLPRAALVPAADFPLTQEVAYLNAAGLGLVPEPVIEQHEELLRELGARGTCGFFSHEPLVRQGPRDAGARLLGADPDSIAIVTNVTEAICQIAWWLRPGAGTNVVSIDVDIAAVTYPWLRVAEETGAEVRFVSARENPADLSVEQIAALVDERTAAISVSHVQWVTGHRFDLATLAELAHAHDALLVVDAMQSVGVVPVDVVASGVDLLVSGSFKWLCSYAGAAVCYLRPELAERIRPTFVGPHSTNPKPPYGDFDSTRLDLEPGARQLEFASQSHGARIALVAAIDYLLEVGIERIEQHVLALNTRLADGVEQLGGRLVTPRDDRARAGILTVAFPGRDAQELVGKLEQRGVIALPRMGYVRFSPHLYNSDADIDHALSVLEEVLDEGNEGLEASLRSS